MEKKVPMRMCVGCRTMRDKRQLIRLVRLADNAKVPAGAQAEQVGEARVLADRTGKASGRGAYICPDVKCLQKARKTRQFERALQVPMTDALFDRLAGEVERHRLFGDAIPGKGVSVVPAQEAAKLQDSAAAQPASTTREAQE